MRNVVHAIASAIPPTDAGPGSSLQVKFGYYMRVLFSCIQRIIASELGFMTQRGNIEECLRAIAMRGSNLSNPTNQPTCLPALVHMGNFVIWILCLIINDLVIRKVE